MANVLTEEKKQQVLALGRLGWSLRRIQQATGIRRETASVYLKAANIAVRRPGAWGRAEAAKPAKQVITDSGAAIVAEPTAVNPKSNINPNPKTLSTREKAKATSKPAKQVITDSGSSLAGNKDCAASPVDRSPRASACEPYRESIEVGLSRGRNSRAIWQELVDRFGFESSYQSVQRFVRKLHGAQVPQARCLTRGYPL